MKLTVHGPEETTLYSIPWWEWYRGTQSGEREKFSQITRDRSIEETCLESIFHFHE